MLNIIYLDASLHLTDKKGDPVLATMKIDLSRLSDSDSNIAKFMEKVDAGVSRLPSNNDAMGSILSTVGKALQLNKKIMDNLSQVCIVTSVPVAFRANCDHGDQVHPILKASWTVLSCVYEVNRPTECLRTDTTNVKHQLSRQYWRQMSKMNPYEN